MMVSMNFQASWDTNNTDNSICSGRREKGFATCHVAMQIEWCFEGLQHCGLFAIGMGNSKLNISTTWMTTHFDKPASVEYVLKLSMSSHHIACFMWMPCPLAQHNYRSVFPIRRNWTVLEHVVSDAKYEWLLYICKWGSFVAKATP